MATNSFEATAVGEGSIGSAHRVMRALFKTFLVVLALIGAPLLHAQENWQVDPQQSVARLSLGTGSNAVEIGLARVNGAVVFDAADPADALVRLAIAPENVQPDYPNMKFTSKSSSTTKDGTIVVTGDLSVTLIERSIIPAEPNEAYHGAEYGEPVVSTSTREVTLVLSNPGLAERRSTMNLWGATVISREGFPALLNVLTRSAWPSALVNDEACSTPSNVGEDYAGTSCTGTLIASISNRVASTGGTGGEGYYGFSPVAAPDNNHATIALDLKLEPVSGSPAVAGAAAGK